MEWILAGCFSVGVCVSGVIVLGAGIAFLATRKEHEPVTLEVPLQAGVPGELEWTVTAAASVWLAFTTEWRGAQREGVDVRLRVSAGERVIAEDFFQLGERSISPLTTTEPLAYGGSVVLTPTGGRFTSTFRLVDLAEKPGTSVRISAEVHPHGGAATRLVLSLVSA
jgi:hypothetical protein